MSHKVHNDDKLPKRKSNEKIQTNAKDLLKLIQSSHETVKDNEKTNEDLGRNEIDDDEDLLPQIIVSFHNE